MSGTDESHETNRMAIKKRIKKTLLIILDHRGNKLTYAWTKYQNGQCAYLDYVDPHLQKMGT
jgi:hypothetical protein